MTNSKVTRDQVRAVRNRIDRLERMCPSDPAKEAAIEAALRKARAELDVLVSRANDQFERNLDQVQSPAGFAGIRTCSLMESMTKILRDTRAGVKS